MTRRLLAAAMLLVGTSACSNVLQLDDYTNAGADDGGAEATAVDASEGGDGAECACVPAPPAGWTGPVALWEAMGQPPPTRPPCAGDYATTLRDGNAALDAPASSCTCACDPPAGLACGAVTITQHNNNCQGTCGTVSVPAGTCVNATTCGNAWDIGTVPLAAGACAAKVSKTTTPPWSWSSASRVCAATFASTVGTCATGQICARVPPAPFGAGACVIAMGDVACPTGYPARHLYFDGAVDTRDCQCTCGAPTGVDCNMGVHVRTWSNQGCGGQKLDDWNSVPRACNNTNPDWATKSIDLTTALPKGGTCAASAPTPVGAVTPQSPTTVCCVN